jgi:hypothetical protein
VKTAPLINNFNGGELSPKIDSRTDFVKYASGCRVMENMVPLIEGGAMRRPGMYYVAPTKTAAEKSRIAPFHFSTTQAYIIEIGSQYMRFYKDRAQITSGDSPYEIATPYLEADLYNLKFTQSADILYIVHPNYPPKKLTRTGHTSWTLTDFVAAVGTAMTITGITKANPAVVTVSSLAAGLADGDIVYISGVVGMTEVNDLFFTVAGINTGAKTFQLAGINSSGYTTYTSGGAAQEAQFGADGSNPGAVAFFEQRLCFAGTDNNPQTLWASGSADFENFTQDADDDSTAFEYSLYSDKVDRIRWLMAADVLLAGTTGGVWKIWSGSASEPIGISNVSARRQFAIGMKDMDAEMLHDAVLAVQRGGTRVRHIAYDYYSDKYVGTDLTRAAQHIALGATRTLSGINDMDYQTEPMQILWAVRADGQLLAMAYDIQEKIYGWFRIVTGKASAVPTIDTVESVVEDNDVTTITLTRETNDAASEDVWDEIESVAVITADDNEDEVWLQVKRTVDGSEVRYVEYFKPHEIFGEIADAFFVDSGLTWEGEGAQGIEGITAANPPVVTITGHTFDNGDKVRIYGVEGMTQVNLGLTTAYTVANKAANTFELSGIDGSAWDAYTGGGYAIQVAKDVSGLDHLEGRQVAVHTDIGVHPQKSVASGAITLAWYANKIHVGLPYDSIIEPMLIEPGSREGTSKGKKKKVVAISASFYESYGCKWGPDEDTLQSIPFGTGSAPALFTGDKDYDFDGDFDTRTRLVIKQDLPLPMTVLSIAPKVEVADG